MIDPRFWSIEHSAGFVLILGFVVFFVGASMFWIRGGIRGGAPPTQTYFVWERSFIMAAVVLTAIGFVLLEAPLQDTDGRVLARTGATAYLFGGVLVVAAEASNLTHRFDENWFEKNHALVVIYVVLAFLAQAAIGGSLLQSGLLAAWIGWGAMVWNIGWLIVSLIDTRAIYIPFLHHLIPFVIGTALLSQGP